MAAERTLHPEHTDDTPITLRLIARAMSPLPPRTDKELAAMRAQHPDP